MRPQLGGFLHLITPTLRLSPYHPAVTPMLRFVVGGAAISYFSSIRTI
jgi:hypothetical protein